MSDPQQQYPPAPGTAPTAASRVPPPYGTAPQASAPSGPASGAAQSDYPVPTRSGSGGVARVAFILAVVSVALAALASIVRVVLYVQANRFRLSLHVVEGLTLGSNVLLFLCCAAALALGILAARGDRKLMAGIAIGVGGVGVFNLAIGFLLSMLTPLLYR
ncbi:hypothetical protein [Microbacterium xylanilyticum]